MEKFLENFIVMTKEINFKNNFGMQGNFECHPKVTKGVGIVNDVNNKYVVEMIAEVKNTQEHPFPMDITITLTGFFTFNGGQHEEIVKWLEFEGAKMLYPHLITKVSEITESAMGSPLKLSSNFPFKQ